MSDDTFEVLGNYDNGYVEILIRPRKIIVKVGKFDGDPKVETFIGKSAYIGFNISGFAIRPGGFVNEFPIGHIRQQFYIVRDIDMNRPGMGEISIYHGQSHSYE